MNAQELMQEDLNKAIRLLVDIHWKLNEYLNFTPNIKMGDLVIVRKEIAEFLGLDEE